MAGVRAFLRRCCRFCQFHSTRTALGALHVVRPPWTGLVWLWLGGSTPRDRFPCNLPLPAFCSPAVPAPSPSVAGCLAVQVADLSDDVRCWTDQTERRSSLARFHSALLSF